MLASNAAIQFNDKSKDVLALLLRCVEAWEKDYGVAFLELRGESDFMREFKHDEHLFLLHHVAKCFGDVVAAIKLVIKKSSERRSGGRTWRSRRTWSSELRSDWRETRRASLSCTKHCSGLLRPQNCRSSP